MFRGEFKNGIKLKGVETQYQFEHDAYLNDDFPDLNEIELKNKILRYEGYYKDDLFDTIDSGDKKSELKLY